MGRWALRLAAACGLLVPLGAAAAPAAQPCPGPALRFQALGPGLWWLPAHSGDANASNRGQVSNLVLAFHGQRVWLLGSGPTPAFGHRLACHIQQRWGRAVTDVISPWPHPTLVLGVAGLEAARTTTTTPTLRHWGHAEVAAAMQVRCSACTQRLRSQLGAAAADLGSANAHADASANAQTHEHAVRVPQHLLEGRQGQLGPWRWWLQSRGEDTPVTVWQWRAGPLLVAPGLLWQSGAPDARDADLQRLVQSTRGLHQMHPAQEAPHGPAAPAPSSLRWLGEQGPPGPARQPAAHLLYWYELLAAVRAAQARGELQTDATPPTAHHPANDPQHLLNWQRAWRQVEAESFQRNLR